MPTYYCPGGCNVFDTYDPEPECGACGLIMRTDPTEFENATERIEEEGIAKIEREAVQRQPKLVRVK